MILLTQTVLADLEKNMTLPEGERKPVVKFFTPWKACTWLISEYIAEDDVFFGLCDLGMGFPELGYVGHAELVEVNGPFGLKIERDIHFKPEMTLSEYADQAQRHRRILA